MKKSLITISFVAGLLIIFSLFGALERFRSFFTGRPYYSYYYPKRYYTYYEPYYYETYAEPTTSYYYYEPVRYYYGSTVSKKGARDTRTTVSEDETSYTITVVLPGYNKSDISVSAKENSIHISAQAPQAAVQQGVISNIAPTLDQTIPLARYIKPEAVTSAYENGILTITIPKASASLSKGVVVPVK